MANIDTVEAGGVPAAGAAPEFDRAAQLAAIVDSSNDAIVSKDLNGVIMTWNRGAERIFGYTAAEAIGRPITMLMPPDRVSEEPGILERIRRGDRVDHYETVRRRKDGRLIDISLSVSPVRDASGRIVGASKIARDITERRQAEERIRLLAQEVDHRAKNMLAVVQAMVRMTRADTVEAFVRAIEGRIDALARAHTLLADNRWKGADLRRIVEEELAPYRSARNDSIFVIGEPIALGPVAAQALAMAVHELATNAAKYGALSSPAGRVTVEWSATAESLSLFWRESGGPPVEPPTRTGFGNRVLDQTIRHQLDGSFLAEWKPEGLACAIRFPARYIEPHQISPAASQ